MKAAKVRRDSTFKSILTKDQYIQYLEQKVARLEKRAARDLGVKDLGLHLWGKI